MELGTRHQLGNKHISAPLYFLTLFSYACLKGWPEEWAGIRVSSLEDDNASGWV